jgi:hypothetical protein
MNSRAIPVALLLAALCIAIPSHAFRSPEHVRVWMAYYYLDPEPARAPDALRALSGKGLLDSELAGPLVAGFLAGVLEAKPDEARALISRMLFLPEREQHMLVLAIWYSGLQEAKTLLKELEAHFPSQKEHIDYGLAHTPVRAVELPFELGPWVLDMLWGYFMATGSDAPVKRIISLLSLAMADALPGQLAPAAHSSLAVHAMLHGRVLEICRVEIERQPPTVSALLEDLVRGAETQR